MIRATDQSKIQQVTLQYNPATKRHYLLTSFTAGYQSGAEVLWYIDELETGNWDGEFAGTGSTGWVPTYTTITSDQDFDFSATATSFTSNGFPFSIEFAWHDFNGMFGLPETTFAGSAAAYTGENTCPTPTPTGSVSPTPTPSPSATPTPAPILQRWGDYNSLIWDPSLTSPSGEQGQFWSVLEFTQGAADQSTVWTPFNDALPFFIAYNAHEQECNVSPGQTCTAKLPAPSGLVNGDVVIAFLDMGGKFLTPPKPPDSTWMELPIANQGNALSMLSGSCTAGDLSTEYAYAHIYGSSTETGTYDFKHVTGVVCGSFLPEIEGFLVGYRGAGQDLSKYVLFGYPAATTGAMVTVGPAPSASPSEGVLLNVFYGAGVENENTEDTTTFSNLTGTPAAMAETPLSGVVVPYLVADVGLPVAQSPINQYSATSSESKFHLFGWQLYVPEQ